MHMSPQGPIFKQSNYVSIDVIIYFPLLTRKSLQTSKPTCPHVNKKDAFYYTKEMTGLIYLYWGFKVKYNKC